MNTEKLTTLYYRFKNNGAIQFVGAFVGFLLVAASVMYLLESPLENTPFTDFFHSLWFSVVTATTVGYGDISPSTFTGRIFAIAIMFLGIAFSSVFTGNITSWLVERNRKKALGLEALKGVRKHWIICGWRSDMEVFLRSFLSMHPELKSRDLVLVNEADSQSVNELRRSLDLIDFHYVRGNFTEQPVLQQASIDTAASVMVLSGDRGRDQEKDSRSIMAAMTIKGLKQKVNTLVELRDSSFTGYLQRLKVEDIVSSEDTTIDLLANLSVMSGMYKTVKSMFDEQKGRLELQELMPLWTGKTFGEVREKVEVGGAVLIGLLENTGQLQTMKSEQLYEAQKTATIKHAIDNLVKVKALETNIPVMCPVDEYVVSPYSRAIVLNPSSKIQTSEEAKKRKSFVDTGLRPEFDKDILLLCGKRSNLDKLIDEILTIRKVRQTSWNSIHVLADFNTAELMELQEVFQDDDIVFFKGDHVISENLERAGVRNASKVIILTEECSEGNVREVDTRTVISAMAVESLNKRAYKIAEIKNQRYLNYLRLSNVEEVVPQDEFQRLQLAHGAARKGTYRILQVLLDKYSSRLKTLRIDQGWVGKTYLEATEGMEQKQGKFLGLIEQTGNISMRKKESIYEAQMQPAISDAVKKLKGVRDLQTNQVILAPAADHIIGPHSSLLFLERNDDK